METQGKLLIVDDELSVRDSLGKWFREEGYEIGTAESASDALTRMAEAKWDLALLDIKMRGTDGIELQRRLHEMDPDLIVIMMTGYASVETAVTALKNGAYDYVSKPLDPDEIAHLVKKALAHKRAEKENIRLRETVAEAIRPGDMVGQSPAMRKVFEAIETVGPTDANVLITGESGTGKELVVRAIHAASMRRFHPLVAIHCGALTETLLESELFGHERGAFTGADRSRLGLFEAAHEGTLFLDEVAEMSPAAQAKLLRVLTDGQVMRIGSVKTRTVDVRVLTATHRDLEQRVKENLFREDLYYRLAVVPISIPPLRERTADVGALCDLFLGQIARELKLPKRRLSGQALLRLQAYEFPGNIRELRNLIERAVILAPGEEIGAEHFPLRTGAAAALEGSEGGREGAMSLGWIEALPPSFDLRNFLSTVEKTLIERTLQSTRGAQAEAARRLGLSRSDLSYKLLKYELRKETAVS